MVRFSAENAGQVAGVGRHPGQKRLPLGIEVQDTSSRAAQHWPPAGLQYDCITAMACLPGIPGTPADTGAHRVAVRVAGRIRCSQLAQILLGFMTVTLPPRRSPYSRLHIGVGMCHGVARLSDLWCRKVYLCSPVIDHSAMAALKALMSTNPSPTSVGMGYSGGG